MVEPSHHLRFLVTLPWVMAVPFVVPQFHNQSKQLDSDGTGGQFPNRLNKQRKQAHNFAALWCGRCGFFQCNALSTRKSIWRCAD